MTRPKYPASSFGDNLTAVLREGASKRLEFKFDTAAIATRFIHRLNSLRQAVKREDHPDWKEFYRCGIYRDRADKRIVVVQPRDSEFDEVLKDIKPSQPLPKAEPVNLNSDDPADAFLASLRDDVPKKD